MFSIRERAIITRKLPKLSVKCISLTSVNISKMLKIQNFLIESNCFTFVMYDIWTVGKVKVYYITGLFLSGFFDSLIILRSLPSVDLPIDPIFATCGL